MLMPPLQTERLLIRPFVRADLDAIHQLLDVELGEGAGDAAQLAQARAARAEWLAWSVLNYTALANLHQPPYGDRAIVLRASGETHRRVRVRADPAALCPTASPACTGRRRAPTGAQHQRDRSLLGHRAGTPAAGLRCRSRRRADPLCLHRTQPPTHRGDNQLRQYGVDGRHAQAGDGHRAQPAAGAAMDAGSGGDGQWIVDP